MKKKYKSMETAPKDGTSILLLDPKGVVYQGSWNSEYKVWSAVFLDEHGCGCCGTDNPEPIGWMPIPDFEHLRHLIKNEDSDEDE